MIKTGQVELLNCGYSMPDQGLPHFDDMLGNYEYGRELCINEFDRIPEIAWTIDAFG